MTRLLPYALLALTLPGTVRAQEAVTIHRGTGDAAMVTEVRIDEMGFEDPQTVTRGTLRTLPDQAVAPPATEITTIVYVRIDPGTRLSDRARHASWLDWTRAARLARRDARQLTFSR